MDLQFGCWKMMRNTFVFTFFRFKLQFSFSLWHSSIHLCTTLMHFRCGTQRLSWWKYHPLNIHTKKDLSNLEQSFHGYVATHKLSSNKFYITTFFFSLSRSCLARPNSLHLYSVSQLNVVYCTRQKAFCHLFGRFSLAFGFYLMFLLCFFQFCAHFNVRISFSYFAVNISRTFLLPLL